MTGASGPQRKSSRKSKSCRAYENNEYAEQDRGVGEEKPAADRGQIRDPYEVLRLQRVVHTPVLEKAFEVRGVEIGEEVPPISATTLAEAYRLACQDPRPEGWQFSEHMSPYQVLEVTPAATPRMIGRVYRVIMTQVHPDKNPDRKEWATRMTQIVTNAYSRVKGDRGQ